MDKILRTELNWQTKWMNYHDDYRSEAMKRLNTSREETAKCKKDIAKLQEELNSTKQKMEIKAELLKDKLNTWRADAKTKLDELKNKSKSRRLKVDELKRELKHEKALPKPSTFEQIPKYYVKTFRPYAMSAELAASKIYQCDFCLFSSPKKDAVTVH